MYFGAKHPYYFRHRLINAAHDGMVGSRRAHRGLQKDAESGGFSFTKRQRLLEILVEYPGYLGSTISYIFAVSCFCLSIVRLFLQESFIRDGKMSLLSACRNGNLHTIARIFQDAADDKLSVDVNEKDYYGCTPLMEASSRGYLSIVKLLKSKGARVNVKDKECNTALSLAAERGHFQVVKLLVEGGAKIDVTDKNGNTAFLLACAKGHKDIALYLNEKGAKPKVVSSIGISALDHAYRHGFGKEVDPEPEKRLNPEKLKPHKGPLSPRLKGRRPASAAVFSGTAESAATTRRSTITPIDYLEELLIEKEQRKKNLNVKRSKQGAKKSDDNSSPGRKDAPVSPTKRDTQESYKSNDNSSLVSDTQELNKSGKKSSPVKEVNYRHYPYFEEFSHGAASEERDAYMLSLLSTSKPNYR